MAFIFKEREKESAVFVLDKLGRIQWAYVLNGKSTNKLGTSYTLL